MKFLYAFCLAMLMCFTASAADYEIVLGTPTRTSGAVTTYVFPVTSCTPAYENCPTTFTITGHTGSTADLTKVNRVTPKSSGTGTYTVKAGTLNCTKGSLTIDGPANEDGIISIENCLIVGENIQPGKTTEPSYSFTYDTRSADGPAPIEFTATTCTYSSQPTYQSLYLYNDEYEINLYYNSNTLSCNLTSNILKAEANNTCSYGGNDYNITSMDKLIVTESPLLTVEGHGVLANGREVTFHYTQQNIKVNISAALYTTFYNADHAVVLPSDVTAYVASVDAEGLHFVQEYAAGDIVPAATAVVLCTNWAETKTLEFAATAGEKPAHANDLKGAATYTTIATINETYPADEYYFYALSLANGSDLESVGFYWVENDGLAFNVPAGRAYLPVRKSLVDTPAGARTSFTFADATAISTVAAEAHSAAAFNIQGQRISEAKGLVVRNGKMMFVK